MIFTSSHIIPFAYENHPLDISAIVLIRITWDITGIYRFGGVVGSAIDVSTATGIISFFDELSHVIMFEKNHRGYVGRYIKYDTKYKTPPNKENIPAEINLSMLFRISWDITGKTGSINFDGHFPLSGPFYREDGSNYKEAVMSDIYYDRLNLFDISRSVPTSDENKPCSIVLMLLCRISWDIIGEACFAALRESLKGVLKFRQETIRRPELSETENAYPFQYLTLSTSYVAPVLKENIPLETSVLQLVRINWDISGRYSAVNDFTFLSPCGHLASGCIKNIEYKDYYLKGDISSSEEAKSLGFEFHNTFVIPCSEEEHPLTHILFVLQRIAWDISGELKGLIGNGTQSTGVFIRYAYEDWSVTNGTSGYKIDGSFKSSRVIPAVKDQPENIPILQALSLMIRVTWSSVKCALKKECFH